MSEPFQPLIQVPLIEAVFEIFVPTTPDIEQQQQRALLGSVSLNKITGTAQLGTSSGWPTEPSHDSVSSTCHIGLPHDDFPSTS
ncbi:MAG: hypothetical protein ACKO6N_11380, partial [Myxococcota bacterium]